MLTKPLTGLDQLRSIQSQINHLVDEFAATGHPLTPMEQPYAPGSLPDQDPALERISILAIQLQAFCSGPRFALTKSLEVSETYSMIRC